MEGVSELAIGEEVVIDGVKVRCKKGIGDERDCKKCGISSTCCKSSYGFHPCSDLSRSDKKNVYYQEVK